MFRKYTLGDLGVLSKLIGSLSRAIQQHSPPSESIMRELAVFPNFLEIDLSKFNKILRLMFLRWEKTSKDSKQRFLIYFNWCFCSMNVNNFARFVGVGEGRNFVNSALPNKKNFISRLSTIVWVKVVLNRTVVVDSDWRFDSLGGSHLQSQIEFNFYPTLVDVIKL